LTRVERAIVERRLQGYTFYEVAAALHCSERTVRRTLERLRDRLARLLPDEEVTAESDFVLHEMIGAGGMGKVYRASLKFAGGIRAVKFLRKSYIHHRKAVRRFIDEAGIVSRLRHPGILQVHGYGSTSHGSYFIVMDLVDGLDLARLATTRSISVVEAMRWVRAAAIALQHAHDHGIIHCDLKPSNLLLDESGEIRVTDFGLARQLAEQQPQFAELAGTAAFMAPEQVDSCWGPIDIRTDVYGLGAVLYTLLTNLPPHVGSFADVLAQVVSGRPHPGVKAVRSNLPDELRRVCDRCMAKNPSERFASAHDVAVALHQFCESTK
jgi:serine/threonine protein kinase